MYWPIAHDEHVEHVVTPPSENFPAVQAVHALIMPTPNVPAGQFVQSADPASEYFPSEQALHSTAPLVFAGCEYFPTPHESHSESRPRAVEYVPSAHSSQSVSTVSEHALHPGSRLYFPAEHIMQGPPEKNV